MAIADAINTIAAAQGGTPDKSGTIAGAIDALNDALAGSDQEKARTIEDAVVLLGEHIGGGGGGGDLGPLFPLIGWLETEVVVANDQELTQVVLESSLKNPGGATMYGVTIPGGCYFGMTQGVSVMEIDLETEEPVGPLTSVGTASHTSLITEATATLDVYLMPTTENRLYQFYTGEF